MQVKSIIFDFFGVICSEIAPFWFQKYFSRDEAKRLKNLYTLPVDLGKVSEAEYYKNVGALVQKTGDEVKLEFTRYIKIHVEMVEMIRKLKPNYKIGLCSNSPSNLIRTIIKRHSLEYLFDEIVISSEYGIVKPDKKIFELILKKLSAKALNSVFIDDNPVHVEAAALLGIKTILFFDPESLKSSLTNLDVKIE